MKNTVFLVLLLAGLCSVCRAETAEREVILSEVRGHADKFEFFPLEYDSANHALIRFIDPAKNFFISKGRRYFGFRFKAPAVVDGDFAWMFLLRSENGPTTSGAMNFYIVRLNGPMEGFTDFSDRQVGDYPALREKFPYSQNLTVQYLEKESFLPNEEYAIWFSVEEGDEIAPYAVAFSFMKKGQMNPDGRLPLGPTRTSQRSAGQQDFELTSYEGDPW